MAIVGQAICPEFVFISAVQICGATSECVFEMREFFGPGWRMYNVQQIDVLIVMLGGGDKSTQQADIAAAIALSKTIQE